MITTKRVKRKEHDIVSRGFKEEKGGENNIKTNIN